MAKLNVNAAVMALFLASWAPWGQAADWAQWRGPTRDGHVPAGEKVPATLPGEIKPRWRIALGDGFASPVVAGEGSASRVFYSDLQNGKETVHAVEALTGREVWQAPLDDVFKDDWGQGPRCTPVVDGPRVFVQSCRGELQCLSRDTGNVLWRKNYVRDFGAIFMGETGPASGATRHGNTGSPVVDGEHLIVQAGGLNGAGLVCLNKATGEVVWKSQDDTAGNASPVVAVIGGVRQVISFTALGLVSVNAENGALLWRVPLKTRLGRHVTTPVVVDDLVIAGSYQVGVVAVKVTRAGTDLKAEPVWTNKEAASNFASPVAAGGYLYGVGPSQNIYCVEARTGKLAWSQPGLLRGSGERAFAAFIVMGKNILLLTDGGELILFRANPAQFEALSRSQACGATWCSPAYAEGSLYVRDAKSLYRLHLLRNDVLSLQDGRFFLDGQPFAEISFNKFDLFWQLYDELAAGKPLDTANPMVQAQDQALRNLHELGFKTIRIFALPWGPAGPAAYAAPDKRKNLYAALDKTLDLCDRHDLRVVWSLGAGAFTDTKFEPGKGWIHGEEQQRELMANPASRGRLLLYRYLDETVARYQHRRAVLMWEISNELTLLADIGDRNRVFEGERMPSLKEVAGFFNDVAGRIKSVDPVRLVNSGGSNMRECQWHLYQGAGWQKDTFEEQFKCFELLYARSAVDVIDIHSYPNHQPGYAIAGANGQNTWLDDQGYQTIARRLGKPLMIGELGLHAIPKTERKVWDEAPNYFESYSDAAAAKPWIVKTLNNVVEAGIPLTYWWCYQSDRSVEQNNPQRFDLERERNPELMACFVAANQRLKAKLGVAP